MPSILENKHGTRCIVCLRHGKREGCSLFRHLTNTMAQQEGDFEKGERFGGIDTMDLLKKIING